MPPPLRASLVQAAAQRALVALWVGVIPALLAVLVLRYLVPPAGAGLRGVVALLGHRFALSSGAALFLLFSALVRYWRLCIPGGRYASSLPAHLVPREKSAQRLAEWTRAAALYEALRSAGARRRLARTLDAERRAEVDAGLGELRAGLESGDAPRTREARMILETVAAPALAGQRRREAVALLGTILATGAAAVAIHARVAQPYRVLSPSMLPTLEPDDLVAGNKLAYFAAPDRLPARGDVVVFHSAAVAPVLGEVPLPDVLVKRVVGLPGDRIAMRGNVPVINGWQVPVCLAGEYVYVLPDASGHMLHGQLVVEFLEDRAYLTVHAAGAPAPGEYQVKPGEVFVLGDNRGSSMDSRAYDRGHGGGVPVRAIEARAQWFLSGLRRNGEADWSRLFRPIDTMQARLRAGVAAGQRVDTGALEEKIARCLKERPSATRPPPARDAGDASAAREKAR